MHEVLEKDTPQAWRKLFIVALIALQATMATVGKNYYDRFLKLEEENEEYDKELEVLQVKVTNLEKVIDLFITTGATNVKRPH